MATASPAAAPLGGPHELTKTDLDAWLDGYVPSARGFGYADAEKRTPVDPDASPGGQLQRPDYADDEAVPPHRHSANDAVGPVGRW